MSVQADVQKLDAGALVELFVLDASALGGTVLYFHAGTNGLGGPVVWQSVQYQPWPIQVRGFEASGAGRLPRPTLAAANTLGTMSALLRDYGDLLGAKLVRKRTFVRYLDAVNFPGGVNPSANPAEGFPDDVYYVEQKSVENKLVVELQLAAQSDFAGVRLPLRLITQTCGWQYRGEGCGYAGPPVAKVDDTPTAVAGEDRCGKRLSSCKLRFGNGSVQPLPYGGFPGTGLLR